jgi:hypothetical protein
MAATPYVGTGAAQSGIIGTPPVTPASSTSTPTTVQLGAAATDSTGAATGQNANALQNTYTAQQQAAQTALLNQLSGYTAGTSSVPTSLTNPAGLQQAANDAFNQYTAPGIAAQYGAGSPQIGQQQSMMDEQLAAQNYQNGVNNYLSGTSQLGNAAYNQIGNTGQAASSNTSNNQNYGASVSATGSPSSNSVLSLILKAMGL